MAALARPNVTLFVVNGIIMKKLRFFFLALLLSSLLVTVLMIALAQTQFTKKYIETKLFELGKKGGVAIKIDGLEGFIPLGFTIKEVTISSKSGLLIQIHNVRCRLMLFSLVKKELGISYLKMASLRITPPQPSGTAREKLFIEQIEKFPLTVHLKTVKIDQLSLLLDREELFKGALKGTSKIKKNGESLFVQCSLFSLEKTLKEDFLITGSVQKKHLGIVWKNHIDQKNNSPFTWYPSIEASLQSELRLTGPWKSFKALALQSEESLPPITCELFARIDSLSIPNYGALTTPWGAHFTATLSTNGSLMIEKGALRSSLGSLTCKDLCFSKKGFKKGECTLALSSIEPFTKILHRQIDGSLTASVSLKEHSLDIDVYIDKGHIDDFVFSHLRSDAHLLISQKTPDPHFEGNVHFFLGQKTQEIEGSSKFSYIPSQKVSFHDLAVHGEALNIGADLFWDIPKKTWEGSLFVGSENLRVFEAFFPTYKLGGAIGAEAIFSQENGQSLSTYIQASNLEVQTLKVEEMTASAHLHFCQGIPSGSLSLDGSRIYLPDLYFSKILLNSVKNVTPALPWEFSLFTKGVWKEPFSATSEGSYNYCNGKSTFSLKMLRSEFLDHPIILAAPTVIAISKDSFSIDHISLAVEEGNLLANCKLESGLWHASLQGNSLPLHLLAPFTPYLRLEGKADIVIALRGSTESIQGSGQIGLTEIAPLLSNEQVHSHLGGNLIAHFEGKTMQLHSYLKASGGQIILLDASFPLSLNSFPCFPATLNKNAPFYSSLLIEGRVEEFEEFLHMGWQKCRGWVEGKLLFGNTLLDPKIHGYLSFHEGLYENDLLGLGLKNIEGTLEAKGGEITLSSLHATSLSGKGSLEGQGSLIFGEELPYHFSGALHELKVVNLDTMEGNVSGPIEIEGTREKMKVKGAFKVDAASFSLPRTLPKDIPDIEVTFVNAPNLLQHSLENLPFYLPVELDLTFDSDRTISFDAKGLNSTWGGELRLYGTIDHILADGSLKLTRGQFALLGKTFQLKSGELSFSGTESSEGLLNITGILNMNDVTITAQLLGSLKAPQLFLQSNPPLTTSDIFSLLLFNKKVAEIKPMQTVELARTILSLSGDAGWNVVGQIGSGLNILGIDTFDIVPSSEGLNQTSITIGKRFYLVRGVLVCLTQSLSFSQFTVEVDLGGGLLFQAENQSGADQSQQIGKLSFKWNKNY